MKNKISFSGRKLSKLRHDRKLTARELSVVIGVSRSTIAMWETNESQPSASYLQKIAAFFGVRMEDLF